MDIKRWRFWRLVKLDKFGMNKTNGIRTDLMTKTFKKVYVYFVDVGFCFCSVKAEQRKLRNVAPAGFEERRREGCPWFSGAPLVFLLRVDFRARACIWPAPLSLVKLETGVQS